VLVTKTADDNNSVVDESCSVKVCSRWEDLWRLAINLDLLGNSEDDQIVIDAEIGLVMVFVFAPIHRIRPSGKSLRVAPIRSKVQIGPSSQLITCAIGAAVPGLELAVAHYQTQVGNAKCGPHSFRVGIAEAGSSLLGE
jgi:hypothetical protein